MSRSVRVWAAVLSMALVGGVTACTDATQPVEVPADALDVRVMQFNIEYGGTVVDFDSVPKAIEAADADVVALQEAYGRTCRVAEAVGWRYCDPRTQVISRFPLVTPEDPSGDEVLVMPEEAKAFGVVNLHLPSAPYGPNKAAAGFTADQLVAGEQGRLDALEPVLDAADRVSSEGLPVVVLGDFNSPSHRDWTTATAGLRAHVIPVDWPVTQAVEDAGYVDAFRSVYPDPASEPGLTWPAARPKSGTFNPGLNGKPADRIDMTFVSSDITVEDALVVGEPGADDSDISVDPWPSDHRGVVTEMTVPLADPGPYVAAASTLVDQGANVEVFGSGDGAERVDVTSTDGGGQPVSVALENGVAVLGTNALALGENRLSLVTADGQPVASASLWVRAPGDKATVTTGRRVYAVGEPIDVSWTNAPGNKWDWLGVYRRGADPDVAYYKNWRYTDATVAGSAVIDGTAEGGPWPLPPGRYDVLLLVDDSYAEVARAPFTVLATR